MTVNVSEVMKVVDQIEAIEKMLSKGLISVEEQDQLIAPLKTELKRSLGLEKPAEEKEKPVPKDAEGNPDVRPGGNAAAATA